MFDPVTIMLCGVIVALLAALCWMVWLYLTTYRRLVTSDRDRDRLIRRIGQYNNLSLILPQERLPELPTEAVVPAAFRMKKPVPPPGYKG